MGKTGRNEPCPCGSGKKYKFCCGASGSTGSNIIPFPGISGMPPDEDLPWQESQGMPNPAIMEGRTFSSLDEAKNFTREMVGQANHNPLDDFLGLSPDQMRQLSTLPLEANQDFLSLKGSISEADIPEIPILRQIIWLIQYLENLGPVKLTAAGYLPPVHAVAWFNECFRPFTFASTLEIRPVRRESDEPGMMIVRDIMKRLKFSFMKTGKLGITSRARTFLNESTQTQYQQLFYFLADEWEWSRDEWSYFEVSPFHQTSLPFYLYALNQQGPEGWGESDVERIYTTAFPYILGEIDEGDFFFHIIMREPARYFTEPLGLTIQGNKLDTLNRVVPSKLFKRELEWGDFR